jgi:hypothetical protein
MINNKKIQQIKNKLKTKFEINKAKIERKKAISKYKNDLKLAKEKEKKLQIILKKEEKEKHKKQVEVDSKFQKDVNELTKKLKENLVFLKEEKQKNKERIKLAKQKIANKRKELIIKHKKNVKLINQKIDEEMKNIKLKKVKFENSNLEELAKLEKESTDFEIQVNDEIAESKKKILNSFEQAKEKKIKLKKIEMLDKEEKIKKRKEEINKNKLIQVEKEIELKLFRENLQEEEIKIQKELLMNQIKQQQELDALKRENLIEESHFKEIEIKKINHSSFKFRGQNPNIEFSYKNVYIPKRKKRLIKKIIEKIEHGSNYYKKKKSIYNEIALYEKLIQKEEPIDIKSIIKAIFVYYDEKFNQELIDELYKIQIYALVSGYSLKLKNNFIKFTNKKYKKFLVLDYVKNMHFSPFEGEKRNFYADLIEEKINNGSLIKLYEGLLLTKMNDKTIILESSKYKG